MNNKPSAITIAPAQATSRLGKAQKTFNRLIQQIGKRRKQLLAWEEITPPFQHKYTAEVLPLLQTARELRIEMVRALDQLHARKGLSKRDRRLLADQLLGMVEDLLEEAQDDELKALYGKYARSDFDQEQAAMADDLRTLFQDGMGMDLGEDLDWSSPEEVMARMQQRMKEQKPESRKSARTQSAKAQAREEQRLAEEKQVSQSIREVYRKLASALHPDRETDPAERDRKTVLMQRANQAYEKGNLLQLLELQIELEHIGQADLDGLGEERLAHYNKVLKEQLTELDGEVIRVEREFQMRFGFTPRGRITPASLLQELSLAIASMQQDLRQMRENLVVFDDIQATKAWLKQLRAVNMAYEYDDIF